MEMEECGLCNGRGLMDCPMEYGEDCPEQCPVCGGTQKTICVDCDGTGQVEEY